MLMKLTPEQNSIGRLFFATFSYERRSIHFVRKRKKELDYTVYQELNCILVKVRR